MNIKPITKTFKSSNGFTDTVYYSYAPKGKPCALLQITHGMCEYIGRYENFIGFLLANNIAVAAHDHIGHGSSVKTKEDYGFFAEEEGDSYLIEDLHTMATISKELYPGLPHILFAHSMGSFAARMNLKKYGKIADGVILCGTSGPTTLTKLALWESNQLIQREGARYRSQGLYDLIFNRHNSKIIGSKTAFDWFTRDEKVIDAFMLDEKVRFIFTASAFRDMFKMLEECTHRSWYDAVPKDLPIYIISGRADPVGQFGMGAKKTWERLVEAGAKDVRLKLYPKCRHELIHELNRQDIINDILEYVKLIAAEFK